MDIIEILDQNSVKTLGVMSSKKRLFHEISEIAFQLKGIDPSLACQALLEREKLGPTGVGSGVALPHAHIKGLESVFGVFVKLDTPLEFEAVDWKPVDLVFALFAPENAGVNHLKALALAARTMRRKDLCEKLRANSDETILHTMLTTPLSQAA